MKSSTKAVVLVFIGLLLTFVGLLVIFSGPVQKQLGLPDWSAAAFPFVGLSLIGAALWLQYRAKRRGEQTTNLWFDPKTWARSAATPLWKYRMMQFSAIMFAVLIGLEIILIATREGGRVETYHYILVGFFVYYAALVMPLSYLRALRRYVVEEDPNRPVTERPWATRLVVTFYTLLIACFVAIAAERLIHALSGDAGSKSPKTQCQTSSMLRMELIARAIQLYQAKYSRSPQHLSELSEYIRDPKDFYFKCSYGTTFFPSASPEDPRIIDLESPYGFASLPNGRVMVFERFPIWQDTVGYCLPIASTKDFEKARVSKSEFEQRYLKEAQASTAGIPEASIFSISEISATEIPDPDAETNLTLRIGVRKQPNAAIDHTKVKIQTYFYDTVDDKLIKLTDAKINYQWLTPNHDWAGPNPEILTVSYVRPKSQVLSTGAESSAAGAAGVGPGENMNTSPIAAPSIASGHRRYFGYRVLVYYNDKLQDSRAHPAKLLNLFPPPPTASPP